MSQTEYLRRQLRAAEETEQRQERERLDAYNKSVGERNWANTEKATCKNCGLPIHIQTNEERDSWWTHTETDPQRLKYYGRHGSRSCPGFVAQPPDEAVGVTDTDTKDET